MKKSVLSSILVATLAIAGCGATSKSSTEESAAPSQNAAFTWTTDALYSAMLDDQLIDSWGYKNFEGVSAVDDFAIDSGNHIVDFYSMIKPSSCETVANLSLARAEIGAKFYSKVDHFDKTSLLDPRSFLLYTYAFESDAKANEVFDSFKGSISECSSFSYAKGSEINNMKLWDQPTVNESNLVIGNDGDMIANAYGINGSAIWTLQIINGSSASEAEAIAQKTAIEVNAKLSAVQGN